MHTMVSPSASHERRDQPGDNMESRQDIDLATDDFGTGCQPGDALFQGRL